MIFSFQKNFRNNFQKKKNSGPNKKSGSRHRLPTSETPQNTHSRELHFQDGQPSQSRLATGSVPPEFRNRAQIGLRFGSAAPLFGAKLLVDSHEHRVRQIITILHRQGPYNLVAPRSHVEDLKVFSSSWF